MRDCLYALSACHKIAVRDYETAARAAGRAEVIESIEELARRWNAEAATSPSHSSGDHTKLVLRRCVQELRALLDEGGE